MRASTPMIEISPLTKAPILKPPKQALLASRDVIISSHNCDPKLQRGFHITLRHKIITYEKLFWNNYFQKNYESHAQFLEIVFLSWTIREHKIPQKLRKNSQGILFVIISCQRVGDGCWLPIYASPFKNYTYWPEPCDGATPLMAAAKSHATVE